MADIVAGSAATSSQAVRPATAGATSERASTAGLSASERSGRASSLGEIVLVVDHEAKPQNIPKSTSINNTSATSRDKAAVSPEPITIDVALADKKPQPFADENFVSSRGIRGMVSFHLPKKDTDAVFLDGKADSHEVVHPAAGDEGDEAAPGATSSHAQHGEKNPNLLARHLSNIARFFSAEEEEVLATAQVRLPESDGEITVRRADVDPERERHYVIVIHGTFDAPPEDGRKTWYQLPEPGEKNFCSKISSLLESTAIGNDSVWRDLPFDPIPGIPYPFHWDGTNTDQGRVDAATKLCKLVDAIGKADPASRIHLVAHSHGGNALLKTVELFLKKLRKRQRKFSLLNPAVQEAFWAAYGPAHNLIKQWKKMDLRHSWLRFFPFVIVWRSFHGKRVSQDGETYPWAYHQWLDSALGLPAVRQRLYLSRRLVTSPIINPLGSLIFLGTPFYCKRWENYGIPLLILSTLVSLFATYVFLVLYVWLWKALVVQSTHVEISSFADQGINFGISTILIIIVLVVVTFQILQTTVFHSGNLYHNPKLDWSNAMSALVIHAGKLDEASLALSTEPVVRAYLLPNLNKYLKRTPWLPLPKRPAIYSQHRRWISYVMTLTWTILWDIIFFIPSALLSLISLVLAPIIANAVVKLVVSVSFGLAPGDLSFSYIYVDEKLELPRASHLVHHWNVQKLLAEAKMWSLQGEMMPGYEDDTIIAPVESEKEQQEKDAKSCADVNGTPHQRPRRAWNREHSLQFSSAEPQHESNFFEALTPKAMGTKLNFALPFIPRSSSEAAATEPARRLTRGMSRLASTPRGSAASDVQSRIAAIDPCSRDFIYSFLWDDRVLEDEVADSPTYQLLKGQTGKIDHDPKLTDRQFERQLKQLCVMFEKRLEELTGRMDMNHGAYFRDPRILQVIAHYLAKRELPDWSKDIDTDVVRSQSGRY